jgi:hypothetical protein
MPPELPPTFTERLGEAVGTVSKHSSLLRVPSALAGFILLILAWGQSDDIGDRGSLDSADTGRGIAAAGMAIGAGLCLLAATRP